MRGALLKLKLVGFQNPEFTQPTGFFYVAQVNPESYSLDHSVVYNEEQAQGAPGGAAAFHKMPPRTMSFEVVFDATGAIGDTPADLLRGAGIVAQVKLFKKTVYDYFGNAHRPPYVQILWGSLLFPCQVKTIGFSYKLFSPEGVPLRATAKVSFEEVISNSLITRLADALSADLTHVRTVQAGDTLPLLCYQIYGDSTLYPQVATANGLASCRSLRVGQQLAFPPLVPADPAD